MTCLLGQWIRDLFVGAVDQGLVCWGSGSGTCLLGQWISDLFVGAVIQWIRDLFVGAVDQ